MEKSLIDGGNPAACKDDCGDDQGPEIELLAVTKGMRLAGRFPASVNTEKKESSVRSVDERMKPFRKHSGTARREGCGKLCDRDYDVGRESSKDGLRGLLTFRRACRIFSR